MKTIKTVTTLLFCCIVLLLAGCTQPAEPEAELPEPSFAAGEPHSNAVAFRLWFETMTSTAGPCTVSIQDKIYDEEQANQWWYAIQADLNTLNQALGLTEKAYTPFTVFIVEKTLHGIQVWNNYLYCTPEDILSGAYREGLIGAAFFAVPWKQVGIAGSVFGTEEVDPEPLATYLTDVEDVDILSLFAAYFVEDFASDEEIALARTAAQLLCEHVIAEHGGAALVEDACIDCRQELLDELGVDRTYTDGFGDFDQGFNYRSSEDYPLIVTTTRGDVFYITPLPGDTETPAEIRTLLYDAWKGPQVILEAVRAGAPEYAEVLAQNDCDPFTCYLNPDRTTAGTGSVTNCPQRQIQLGNREAIVHEIMHLLVPPPALHNILEQWKYEAWAEYASCRYATVTERETIYGEWFSDPDGLNREDYADETGYLFDQKVLELYLAHAGFPQTAADVDVLMIRKGVAHAFNLFPDYRHRSLIEVYRQNGLGGLKAGGGNELSYFEACVFADYLIGEYSLSAFLGYCLDEDATFEGTFGIDYKTAKAAWLEELMGM